MEVKFHDKSTLHPDFRKKKKSLIIFKHLLEGSL